jgi:hypothetical protein
MKSPLLIAVLVMCVAKTLLPQPEDFPTRVESDGRVVEWVSGTGATIADRDSLVLQAMGYLPQGAAELRIEVQISEPTQIDGQTIVSGRYLFSGIAATGCDFRMLFAGDTMVAIDRPLITEADIFVTPPPIRISTDAAREIAVFPHDPNDPIVRESMAGTLFAWELLNALRQWGEELRLRNNIVWLSIGAPKRGIAGNRPIRVVRAESRPAALPLGGLYFDSTGTPTIGLSEANDLYHCFANAGVIAHEWGHSLLLSFTGRETRGPPPHGHDLVFHEVIGDVMAWLYQEEVDLSGEPQGVVGLGQKRGFEDVEFRRDIRRGRTCDRNVDADRPCTPRGGLGLYPVIGEVHDASLPISGFFYDLGALLRERYGDQAGHQRITDLVLRFLAYHSGGIVERFGYQQVVILLLLNDHKHFGGDQIPFNYGPDWDLIRQAALGRNLWLIPFERGDSDGSGDRTISDAVFLLNYLFLGDGEPNCHDAADADDSGELTLTDAVRLLGYLFLGGEALPLPLLCREPDPARRLDPTPLDRLTCRVAGSHCSN